MLQPYKGKIKCTLFTLQQLSIQLLWMHNHMIPSHTLQATSIKSINEASNKSNNQHPQCSAPLVLHYDTSSETLARDKNVHVTPWFTTSYIFSTNSHKMSCFYPLHVASVPLYIVPGVSHMQLITQKSVFLVGI